MTAPAIPHRLGHIWVGGGPAPIDWMQTWRDLHPDWTCTLFGNDYLTGRRWRNQALINEYFNRRRFEGVSDLMRCDGPGKVNAEHLWGSTMDRYDVFPEPMRAALHAKVAAKLAARLAHEPAS
jgi:hypothetical protein